MSTSNNNLAAGDAGAQVLMSTGSNSRHGPENVLDGKESTFWLTTGLSHHELTIQLTRQSVISAVHVDSTNVKQYIVGIAASPDGPYEELVTRDVMDNNGGMQSESVAIPQRVTGQFLRYTIADAHAAFPSVHNIVVDGDD